MLSVHGWAVVRSSRLGYEGLECDAPEIEALDRQVQLEDERLFDSLEALLAAFQAPDLDWHFRRKMNNDSGLLLFASSRNHRGGQPSALQVLKWLAEQSPSSYGLAYLHDDEDSRNDGAFAERYRVWRLLAGKLDEMADPFLGPTVPDRK